MSEQRKSIHFDMAQEEIRSMKRDLSPDHHLDLSYLRDAKKMRIVGGMVSERVPFKDITPPSPAESNYDNEDDDNNVQYVCMTDLESSDVAANAASGLALGSAERAKSATKRLFSSSSPDRAMDTSSSCDCYEVACYEEVVASDGGPEVGENNADVTMSPPASPLPFMPDSDEEMEEDEVTDDEEEEEEEDFTVDENTAPQENSTRTIERYGQLTPGTTPGSGAPGAPGPSRSVDPPHLDRNWRLSLRGLNMPELTWGDRDVFKESMMERDEFSITSRDPFYFYFQNHVTNSMRLMLLEWLSEVAEVHKMKRETFYKAIDYFDRFFSVIRHLHKSDLQIFGVTILNLAAKMEEIYPPPMSKIADMTTIPGTENRMRDMEALILQTIKWDTTPLTPVNWASHLLQFMAEMGLREAAEIDGKPFPDTSSPHGMQRDTLLKKIYEDPVYVNVCRLLDVVILDDLSLKYSYGILAAAAIYYYGDKRLLMNVTGLTPYYLKPCLDWMRDYHSVVDKATELIDDDTAQYLKDHPNLQIRTSASLFCKVQKLKRSRLLLGVEPGTPEMEVQVSPMMTPPSSGRRGSLDF